MSVSAVVADENPQNIGDHVTLTATEAVTPGIQGAPDPTGLVFFYDGATLLGSSAVSTSGGTSTAAYQTNTLTTGTHSIAVTDSGDANYAGSSASMTENIIGLPASMTIPSGSNQSATVGAAFPYPLIVKVVDSSGTPISNVAVTFAGTGLSFSSGGQISTDTNGEASVEIATCGAWRIVATLEFIQHQLSKMGHGKPPVT